MDTQRTLGTRGRHEDIVGYVGGQVGHEGHLKDPVCLKEMGNTGTQSSSEGTVSMGRGSVGNDATSNIFN